MAADFSAEVAELRAKVAALEARLATDATEYQALWRALSVVPSFLMLVDENFILRQINRVQPGLDLAAILGHSVTQFLPPEVVEEWKAHQRQVLVSGQDATFEGMATGPNGSMSPYRVHSTKVEHADGRLELLISASDITHERAQQQALQQSEEILRVALEATGMGLWATDVIQGVSTWDERMKRVHGCDEPCSGARYLDKFVHPDDRAAVRARISRLMTTGVFESLAYRIRRPDGADRWLLAIGKVNRDPVTSVATEVFGGILDITEQRQTEQRLLHAQRMETVGQMAAGIAHNFNNMLAVITPVLQMVITRVPDGTRGLVEDAITAAGRAAELVRELMLFARTRQPAARRLEGVSRMIEASARMARRVFGPTITVDVRDDSRGARIYGNAAEIEQALLNILVNARDAVMEAGREHPQVAIHVFAERGHITIRISDNGLGMTDEVRRRVFEPFFSTKEAGKGTGLGLSTSSTTVLAHGGSLRCESALGHGSTFEITFPLASPVGADQPAVGSARSYGRGESVLVIDDDESVRRTMCALLEEAGFVVVAAASGEEALMKAPSGIAAILLDRVLPGRAGSALVRELRRALPAAGIAYYTGNELTAAESAQVDAVIPKPANRDDLVVTLRALIDDRPAARAFTG